jgi:hypothetical protein
MSTNHQFSISLPEGWEDTTCHTFQGPHDSGVQHNLVLSVVGPIDGNTSTAQFARAQIRESAAELPGFEMISERALRTQNSLPMHEIVYRYTPSDGLTFYQKQYYVIAGEKAYIFTSTFTKKTLQTVANEVDKIVATLGVMAAHLKR